ncbi:MAG: hypothetical protein L6Q71_06525 [Planctomycetes bacterium]|nr:hypothetical protein [Planctomycetota bacterium]NUQ34539.1 hypothetical protein [Planctomycetaceae bacterium]
MSPISGINPGNGPNSVQPNPTEARRSLLAAASRIFESENGERNAQATGRFAAQRGSRGDGVGGAIDIQA